MDQQKIFDSILKFLVSFLGKDEQINIAVEVPQSAPAALTIAARNALSQTAKPIIDWNNPECKVSKYFTVKEALLLPSWNVLHIPSEEEKTNILKQAQNMDKVRDFLGAPIRVHCWIRPILNNPQSSYHGQDYNAFVKGGSKSAHKAGLATDYDAQGLNCDDVRAKLEPKLEEFGLRMERMPGGNWVHNGSDDVPAGGNRYFIP